MTDPIKAKIQELVPRAIQRGSGKQILGSPITLAVVLRAIGKAGRVISVRENGTFMEYEPEMVWRANKTLIGWDLEHDNYDQQSEECKQFISSLLGLSI